MSEELEEWRPVVGWEGLYEVSNIGRVRSVGRLVTFSDGRSRRAGGRIVSDSRKGAGYRGLTLKCRPRRWSCYSHRLVVDAFLGGVPDGMEINHRDGNKANNAALNLEVCTRSENGKHSYRVLGNKSCERHPMAKLTNENAKKIVRLVMGGMSRTKAAAAFGVSRTIADNIMKGWIWSGATGLPRLPRRAN